MKFISRQLLALGLLGSMGLLPLSASAQAVKKVLTDVKASCPTHFDFEGGLCVAKEAEVKALGADKCNVAGVAFIDGKCHVVKNQAPAPKCGDTAPPSIFDAGLKACVVSDDRPRSSLGDYVGDCFRIRALPDPSPIRGVLTQGKTYLVVSQRAEGESDKVLRLAETEELRGLNANASFNCRSKEKGKEYDLKASDLIAVGADRSGWTYGVLALPYKFHTDDKSFGSSVSIGPYFGRRWGVPGSAYTLAVAATIGTVKGEIRDAQDKITSTPDLQAFSLAAGWMWDIAKGAGSRPFKVGLFAGADVVGSDNAVKYKHNRKPWVAFQVGFDFTDN